VPVASSENFNDVAAIITSMTDGEKPFLYEAVKSVLSEDNIGQLVLCIEEKNHWLANILKNLAHDPRLRVVRLPLMPVGAVRNHALSHIQLPWVAYCDGDDAWCPHKIAIQRALADKRDCDLVGGDHYLMDEQGQIRAVAIARHLPMLSSWLVRTDIMRQHPFKTDMTVGSDGRWWIETTHSVKKARCPNLLLRYRVRNNSLSEATPSKQRKTKAVALAKFPIIGPGILASTYVTWYLNRRTNYI